MAKSGKWNNELCAEHDGSIASFKRLDLQLDDITEYKKIFKRELRDFKKIGTISALSLGGAIAIGYNGKGINAFNSIAIGRDHYLDIADNSIGNGTPCWCLFRE